jgi:FixJ family two-component response regulator
LTTVPVISIIDDDASVRLATDNLVTSLGYVAHTFTSAEEFLLSAEMNDTTCIIADVQMPEMTGVELQSLMRSRGSCVPFIFITAYPEERIRAQVLHAGATCFLSKPFDGRTLIKYLDTALETSPEKSKAKAK